MSAENVETVRRGYAAFARGDMEAFLALVDPAVEWTEPEELPYGGTHRGHQGLGDLAARWRATYDDMRVEPQEYLDAGDSVVVIGRYRMTAHGGGRFDASFVHVWDLSGGRIARYRDFTDKAAKLERAMAAA